MKDVFTLSSQVMEYNHDLIPCRYSSIPSYRKNSQRGLRCNSRSRAENIRLTPHKKLRWPDGVPANLLSRVPDFFSISSLLRVLGPMLRSFSRSKGRHGCALGSQPSLSVSGFPFLFSSTFCFFLFLFSSCSDNHQQSQDSKCMEYPFSSEQKHNRCHPAYTLPLWSSWSCYHAQGHEKDAITINHIPGLTFRRSLCCSRSVLALWAWL